MHVGYERGGWRGMLVSGGCFILPAVLLTGTLGWLYVTYGSLPEVQPFLVGINPAVLAVIIGALWRLGKKAVTGWHLVPIGVAVAALLVAGLSEVVALLIGGVLGTLWLVFGKGGEEERGKGRMEERRKGRERERERGREGEEEGKRMKEKRPETRNLKHETTPFNPEPPTPNPKPPKPPTSRTLIPLLAVQAAGVGYDVRAAVEAGAFLP